MTLSPDRTTEGVDIVTERNAKDRRMFMSTFNKLTGRPVWGPIAAVWLAAVCLLTLPGCNYFILLGYLIGGPPSIEPEFDAMTRKSLTDEGVTVAIVCYAPTELKWDFDEIDHELAKYVAYRLHENYIATVNPDMVRAWLDEHPDWDKPEEIGRAFNTTHVIYIDLQNYGLYEPNSANLYRGRADGMVNVFEMYEDGGSEKVFTKDFTSVYPLQMPRSTSEVSYPVFKREYLSRLSTEIGRLFYPWYNGDDIPDAT